MAQCLSTASLTHQRGTLWTGRKRWTRVKGHRRLLGVCCLPRFECSCELWSKALFQSACERLVSLAGPVQPDGVLGPGHVAVRQADGILEADEATVSERGRTADLLQALGVLVVTPSQLLKLSTTFREPFSEETTVRRR